MADVPDPGDIDSDDLAHLTAEAANGIGPESSPVPDSPQVRAQRDQLAKEIAAIRAQGLVPDVGMEFPDTP